MAKGLVLEYLAPFHEEDNTYHFHLITHEQEEFSLNETEAAAKRSELAKKNISWYPVNYKSGNFLLFKKAYNFLETFFITARIKRNYKAKAIMGFLSIPGAFSYILSRVFRLKLIIYCFEPHSEYMADFKIWTRSSLKYKLLHAFEKLQLKHADHIVVPNHHTEKLAQSLKKESTRLYVCPICIDTDLMKFDAGAREKIRNTINAVSKKVMIYTGKFDGIYYSSDQVIAFYKKLHDHDNNLFFYIITPNTVEVSKSIKKFELSPSAFHLSSVVSYSDLNKHISAADVGFVALPPLPSQKFRTPVKSAIYLSCGIPYLVNKGIAEDDIIAEKERTGVVINDLNEDPALVCSKIDLLLKENELRDKCRSVAVKTRSIPVAGKVIKEIFSSI